MDKLVDGLEKKIFNQMPNEKFRLLIIEHSKYLSCELVRMQYELQIRTKPLIIAISRVCDNHREI